jgi:hypothetical protein
MRTQGTVLRTGPDLSPRTLPAAPRHGGTRSALVAGIVMALLSALSLLLTAPLWRGVERGPSAPVTCDVPAPVTAEAYAAAFAHLPDGWLAGDQASSTPLPDGRVLWVFADTLVRDAGGGGERLAHGSFVVQTAGCFTPVLGGSPDGVLPAPESGEWYWPQHAAVDRGRIWVFALRVAGGRPNAMDFRLLGVDLAEFDLPWGGTPRFVTLHRTPASDAGDFEVLWGAAVAVQDELLYIYGTRRVDDPLVGKQLLLARVPISRVTEQAAWQFRTSMGWSADPDDAVVLVPARGGVSTALSAHRSTAGWVLVTKRDDFVGDAVVALVGPRPWGPFREQALFDSAPCGSHLEYLPMAHPEAALADGSLLISLNHNETSLSTVLRDPAAFRPTFHSVAGLG